MALVKQNISKSLEEFLLSLQDQSTMTPQDKAKIKKYADGFSDWLIKSMKSATVTVEPGITVTTAGTATAQKGATDSPGKGSIS